MKILLISDTEDKSLWNYYTPDKTEGIDLILSCGDLDPDYLQFLTTVANKPLLYVRGNHDGVYDRRPPEGCENIDGQIYNFKGLRILGLGGCLKYKDSADMYTEKEMAARIRKLYPKLKYTNGFDLLLTHSPAEGYGDMSDPAHHGFACFNALLDKWHPAFMAHGHVHQEYGHFNRLIHHPSGTVIVNACGSCAITVHENQFPAMGKTGSALYDWNINRKSRARKY